MKSAASGFLALSAAKLAFMLSGYAIYFFLPRILNDPAAFGQFGVALGYLNVFNMTVIVGTIQAVSRFVSSGEYSESSIRRTALSFQFGFGWILCAAIILTAPWIAGVLKDPGLVRLIRIGALLPCVYALYGVVMGELNGRKLFARQSALDVSFALLKTILVLAFAFFGDGVPGAFLGYLLASLVIIIIGFLVLLRVPARAIGSMFSCRILINFQCATMLITLFNNLLLNLDLFAVKALMPAECSGEAAGFYTAAQTFSRIPYICVVAIGLVAFPLISSSRMERDPRKTTVRAERILRVTLLYSCLIATGIAALAPELLQLVYPKAYMEGRHVLRILPIGEVFYSMMFISFILLTGSGLPTRPIRTAVLTIGLEVFGLAVLVPVYGIEGAAIGAGVFWLIGMVMAFRDLRRSGFTLLRSSTWINTCMAGASVYAVGYFLPLTGFLKLAVAVPLMVMVYSLVLIIRREIAWRHLFGIRAMLHSGSDLPERCYEVSTDGEGGYSG